MGSDDDCSFSASSSFFSVSDLRFKTFFNLVNNPIILLAALEESSSLFDFDIAFLPTTAAAATAPTAPAPISIFLIIDTLAFLSFLLSNNIGNAFFTSFGAFCSSLFTAAGVSPLPIAFLILLNIAFIRRGMNERIFINVL